MERLNAPRNTGRLIAVGAVVAVALVSGCTTFKRYMYAGWGRDAWQQPERVVRELGIRAGDRVADLGVGGGYFTFHLADAVGPTGRVYAVDVDEGMIDYVKGEAARRGYPQVETVLAAHDDPRLPADGVDLIFTCDTYHHLENRTAYFKAAARYLGPGGRIAILDYNGKGWFVRLFKHFTPPAVVKKEMEEAGYGLVAEHDFIERQSFLIYARRGG
jgi:ubiquinone/menaquinone biosynthesis C-methylase UbiE